MIQISNTGKIAGFVENTTRSDILSNAVQTPRRRKRLPIFTQFFDDTKHSEKLSENVTKSEPIISKTIIKKSNNGSNTEFNTEFEPRTKKLSDKGKRKFRRLSGGNSYGIILFSKIHDDDVVLLFQRRDSYAYTYFITGGWKKKDELYSIFSDMTEDERTRILSNINRFNRLWKDLFVAWKRESIASMYSKARYKFESVKSQIPEIISSTRSNTASKEWGLPKGMPGKTKDFESVAIRECYEETHVKITKDNIISPKTVTTRIVGGDDKRYIYTYFVAYTDTPVNTSGKGYDTPNLIRKRMFTSESDCSKWVKLSEVKYVAPKHVCDAIDEGYDIYRNLNRIIKIKDDETN